MDHHRWKFLLAGFPDKELERQFNASIHKPAEMRFLLICGLVFYILFLIIDFILVMEYFKLFLFIRCGVYLPVSVITFVLSFTRYCKNTSYYYIPTLVAIGSIGIIYMGYLTRSSSCAGLYFYGIFVALMFLYGIGKTTVLFSLVLSFIILIPAIYVEAVFVETNPRRLMMKIVFLFLLIGAGNFTGAIIQYTSRENYLKKRGIDFFFKT